MGSNIVNKFITLYTVGRLNKCQTAVFLPHHCVLGRVIEKGNLIGGVMVSVLASRAVDRRFVPRSGQTKIIQLAFVASPLSTQH